MIRKTFIKIVISFISGVIAGVAGVWVYQVWGRPTLPSYTMDVIDSETIKRLAQALMDAQVKRETGLADTLAKAHGEFWKTAADVMEKVNNSWADGIPSKQAILDSLAKTQPIRVTPYKCFFCGEFIEANGYSRICSKCVTPSR